MSALRVLLVDDHEVVRAGLRAVLEAEEGIEIAGEASSATEAVERADALKPDLVLLDVRLGEGGDAGGIETCRELRSALPDTKVLMFSSYGERETVLAAILAGASGYLMKNVGRAQLIAALKAVGGGESLLDPSVTRPLLDKLVELSSAGRADDGPLSPREKEVLQLVARGYTNKAIAAALFISEHTARNHVTHILDKLGLSRRSEAAAYAVKLGLLDSG
jgi:DNA-binding NarL/FixJ family response regulator